MASRVVVNGTARDIDAPSDAPLLWVLRDEMGLSSPKYGCGLEQCGACRVIVDGMPLASCQVAVGDIAGRNVETLEGLLESGAARRVVDALIAINAGQCAFCLPGIAVTLTNLARQEAPVDDAVLLRSLDDHLCRCGSQPRILRAARSLLGIEVVDG